MPSFAPLLLVDDDPFVLTAVSRSLGRAGYDVRCASSPFGVTALLRKHRPLVAVLDVEMPGLDGPHLVRVIRSSPATSDTVVVFYSGAEEGRLRNLAAAHGVAYAAKSAGPIKLRESITHAVAAATQRVRPAR